MWGIFLAESDGYTYSAKSLVGLYSSKDLAETALLEHIELMSSYEAERRLCAVERQRIIQNYKNQSAAATGRNKAKLHDECFAGYQAAMNALFDRESLLPSSLFSITESDMTKYEINEIGVDQPRLYYV